MGPLIAESCKDFELSACETHEGIAKFKDTSKSANIYFHMHAGQRKSASFDIPCIGVGTRNQQN